MSLFIKVILDRILSNTTVKLEQKRLHDKSPAKKYLSTSDIVFIGLNHTMGAGIYVLSGMTTQCISGFSLILSFLLPSVISILTAFCYADISSLVSERNNVCAYINICLGKYWALITAWILFFKHMIGISFVAIALTEYLDSFMDGAISNSTYNTTWQPEYIKLYTTNVNVFAAGLCLVYGAILISDVKKSLLINSFLTHINLLVMSCVIFMAAYIISWNTTYQYNNTSYDIGHLMKGTLIYFYVYISYDSMTITGKKAKNPAQNTPQALTIVVSMMFFMYFIIDIMPYSTGHGFTALLKTFSFHPLPKWLISVGILCGITSTLFGPLFFSPSIIHMLVQYQYTKFNLNKYMKTYVSCFICATVSALICLLCDLKDMILLILFGTLWTNILITICVIIIRYKPKKQIISQTNGETVNNVSSEQVHSSAAKSDQDQNGVGELKPKYAWFKKYYKIKNKIIIKRCMIYYTMYCVILSKYFLSLIKSEVSIVRKNYVVFCFIMVIICLFVINTFKQNSSKPDEYQLPFVPFLPALSIFLNITLLVLHLPRILLPYLNIISSGVSVGLAYLWFYEYVRGYKTSRERGEVETENQSRESINQSRETHARQKLKISYISFAIVLTIYLLGFSHQNKIQPVNNEKHSVDAKECIRKKLCVF